MKQLVCVMLIVALVVTNGMCVDVKKLVLGIGVTAWGAYMAYDCSQRVDTSSSQIDTYIVDKDGNESEVPDNVLGERKSEIGIIFGLLTIVCGVEVINDSMTNTKSVVIHRW